SLPSLSLSASTNNLPAATTSPASVTLPFLPALSTIAFASMSPSVGKPPGRGPGPPPARPNIRNSFPSPTATAFRSTSPPPPLPRPHPPPHPPPPPPPHRRLPLLPRPAHHRLRQRLPQRRQAPRTRGRPARPATRPAKRRQQLAQPRRHRLLVHLALPLPVQ